MRCSSQFLVWWWWWWWCRFWLFNIWSFKSFSFSLLSIKLKLFFIDMGDELAVVVVVDNEEVDDNFLLFDFFSFWNEEKKEKFNWAVLRAPRYYYRCLFQAETVQYYIHCHFDQQKMGFISLDLHKMKVKLKRFAVILFFVCFLIFHGECHKLLSLLQKHRSCKGEKLVFFPQTFCFTQPTTYRLGINYKMELKRHKTLAINGFLRS